MQGHLQSYEQGQGNPAKGWAKSQATSMFPPLNPQRFSKEGRSWNLEKLTERQSVLWELWPWTEKSVCQPTGQEGKNQRSKYANLTLQSSVGAPRSLNPSGSLRAKEHLGAVLAVSVPGHTAGRRVAEVSGGQMKKTSIKPKLRSKPWSESSISVFS